MNTENDITLPPLGHPREDTYERHPSARSSKTLSPNWLRQRDELRILPPINNANNWRGKLQKLRELKVDVKNDSDPYDDKRFTSSNTPFGMVTKGDVVSQYKTEHTLPPINKTFKQAHAVRTKKGIPLSVPKPLNTKMYLDPDISSEERFNRYIDEVQTCNDAYVAHYLRAMSKASREQQAVAGSPLAQSPTNETSAEDADDQRSGHWHRPADISSEKHTRATSWVLPGIDPSNATHSVSDMDTATEPTQHVNYNPNKHTVDAKREHGSNKLPKLTAITRQEIEAKLARRDYALIDENFFKPARESTFRKNLARSRNFMQDVLLTAEREVNEVLKQKRRQRFISMKETVKAPKYGLNKPRNVVYNSFHGILGQESRDGGWTFTETFKSRKNLEIFEP